MKKRITVLVSNDLTHDQRVRKVCESLQELGFDIYLLGRKMKGSVNMDRNYPWKRLNLFFHKGVLFYASLNIRFFFFLLFHKTDVILANDLDVLLPAFLVSRWRRKKLVYDSHEYFTEAAGLTGRNFQKNVWLKIEKWIFPKLSKVFTVNESIAEIYRDKYQVPVEVVRNIPPRIDVKKELSRSDLDLPLDKKIILLQGAYIDFDRGAKELAQSMKYVDGALLLIIGAGQEIDTVKKIRVEEGLEEKIKILPKLPFEKLQQYTLNADLGVSIDKPLHLNYKLSLPNKLFDYIQCEIPILTSALPELLRVHSEFEIGETIENHDIEHIAEKINSALYSDKRIIWKENLKKAAVHYTWENEAKVIAKVYQDLL